MTKATDNHNGQYIVGTWTFTNRDVPLDTGLYFLQLGHTAGIRKLAPSAAAVYYGTVEPGGHSLLLLHNDIDRSAMSRQRLTADGSVVEEGRWSGGGQGGSYISFDPSERYFAVANSMTGWAVFRNGATPELIATMRNEGNGPHPRQAQSHPHCIIFSPDNVWIYATDLGSDEVLAFPFDVNTGRVGDKVRAYRAIAGSGPRHVLFRGSLLYLLNELGSTLIVLRPESNGTLTELQSVSTLPPGFTGDNVTAHLALSRDVRYLYVSNRGHNSIALFEIGADGLVEPRQWTPSGGKWPWFLAIGHENKMIVANNLSDVICVFDIGAQGELNPSGQFAVRRPVYIAQVYPQ